MTTLLQRLLLETLSPQTDPILRTYLETVLPAMETEFASISALGGSEAIHLQTLTQMGDRYAREKAQRWAQRADQNLCVHVLNALLTAWNLIPHLKSPLMEVEKRLLCLGMTLHDYNKYCTGEEEDPPKAHEVEDILNLCRELGEKLNFDGFWPDWQQYISEIAFLAQNTQFKAGTNAYSANYPPFKLKKSRRLQSPLRHLLAFGDIAVHIQDAGELETGTTGKRLREHLRPLGIRKSLVYHRLRDTLGMLTNGIHNAVLIFAQELDWKPILFFAQGVIYLAPPDADLEVPDRPELKAFIWHQISQSLGSKMLGGEIGFKRDGKGLKVAPQTLELFTPSQLIRNLPRVVAARVNNANTPATPKRLEKLDISAQEREELGGDLRSDRLAEFLSIIQKEFFSNSPEYIEWVLETLNLQAQISPEKTQVQAGGVNYGWYYVAACYIFQQNTWDLEKVDDRLNKIANDLADWAEANNLLSERSSPTREVFDRYLDRYLEVRGWDDRQSDFEAELLTYTTAKTKLANAPICSLSSGEFISEDRMDSVVLFKPQQYSNKNPLGERQIKRGISKIWALEMLLRQALWSVPAGKLEDRKPIFLYIFPAYVYSPQLASAIRLLVNAITRVNFWEVCQFWSQKEINVSYLRSFSWLEEEVERGEHSQTKYESADFPFMATYYTTTRGKTRTEAWVEPAFLATILPFLLGVKVVATSSSVPIYNSDRDFVESTILDGAPDFWTGLYLPNTLRVREFDRTLTILLAIYSLHLDSQGKIGPKRNPRWQALNNTVREVITDVLNVFVLAQKKFRAEKRNPNDEEVCRYWKFANILTLDKKEMTEKLKFTQQIVREYRTFYQVRTDESSHAILLPLSKALETILSAPINWDDEELILQGAGQLHDALERQKVYKRPLITDKTIPYTTRQARELEAIQTFMTTCVKQLFGQMCKGDRALLQEHRNRIKSGAEFAYRRLQISDNR
ncbi:type I-D CRISPR-associated protein Cas10d/Csc3 [Oscillatoriales cyanobacterium LEGE 11467]|uniref:Type I-D CRISPR-associated protein Cas10d/Csc3 n=1 Tax=Zarconia navalis LEGE 11467 TaxID=1828826 RepID=A0A928Z8B2_9CYAN|nr:type I-D CRISPR-associated protein Cas10d/Csc3 [Zarconia navalis]MBE9041410.1 type I-D CRISPR-associated protein Cas10d/Csc3 [Zarconia navalis LEGE 11467]